MGLSNRKEEQLKEMPLIKTRISKSKDGKFVVHRTEIVSIKPTAYYEAVMNDSAAISEETQESLDALKA